MCALYLASISHVDQIHMGDTSQIQGSRTVVARQALRPCCGGEESGAAEQMDPPKTTRAQGSAEGKPEAFLPRNERIAPIQPDLGSRSPGFVEKHKLLG